MCGKCELSLIKKKIALITTMGKKKREKKSSEIFLIVMGVDVLSSRNLSQCLFVGLRKVDFMEAQAEETSSYPCLLLK